MHYNFLSRTILFFLSSLFLSSCESDFNPIGDTIIGTDNEGLSIDTTIRVSDSLIYSGPVATNNFAINSLGVFPSEVFGETIASFVTQVQLNANNPVIDINLKPEIEDVTLYIPYYSRSLRAKDSGAFEYQLDSIYPKDNFKDSKIKLSIYENINFLGDRIYENEKAVFDESYPILYYSSPKSFFNLDKGSLLYSSTEFFFSDQEHKVITKTNDPLTAAEITNTTYLPPGIRVNLDKKFFNDRLFASTSSVKNLSANLMFEQYFKGLFFKVEKSTVGGAMARLNFKEGTVRINYKENQSASVETKVSKTFQLNLTGRSANVFENNPTISANSFSNHGKDLVFLKGGEGSISQIKLSNLAELRAKEFLIREAVLTCYVDQNTMKNEDIPKNLVLYDIVASPSFVGIATLEDTNNGKRYRFKVTEYIKNLIESSASEAKLRLALAYTTKNLIFNRIFNSPVYYGAWEYFDVSKKATYLYPQTSAASPLGVVLYGASHANQELKMKLEIFYTKPN